MCFLYIITCSSSKSRRAWAFSFHNSVLEHEFKAKGLMTHKGVWECNVLFYIQLLIFSQAILSLAIICMVLLSIEVVLLPGLTNLFSLQILLSLYTEGDTNGQKEKLSLRHIAQSAWRSDHQFSTRLLHWLLSLRQRQNGALCLHTTEEIVILGHNSFYPQIAFILKLEVIQYLRESRHGYICTSL